MKARPLIVRRPCGIDEFLWGGAQGQLPLCLEPPEEVGVRQGLETLLLAAEIRVGIISRSGRVDPGDPSVAAITVIGLEGVAFALLVVLAVGVVVTDRVVPIRDPYRAVGADFRRHRGGPRVGRGVEIVLEPPGLEAVAVVRVTRSRHEMHGRFAHQGSAVPPALRETTGRVQGMTRARGVEPLRVVLEKVGGNGGQLLVLVCPRHLLGLAAQRLEMAVGNGEMPTRVAIGGRSHHVALLGKGEAPGVVGGVLHHLEAIFLELKTEHALG